MNNTKQFFGLYLQQSLASTAQMNEGQVNEIFSKYLTLTKRTSPETAFRVIMEAYGNEDTETAVSIIAKAIIAADETHKVERDPRQRLKNAINRLNADIDKVCVTVDGVELSKAEIESAKIKIPACFKEARTYTALGTHGRIGRFAIDVMY